MGLPSGNRWAYSNLDSTGPYFFQESPFQYGGSFFSWGNMVPHNPISETKFDYNFGRINSEAPWYDGQPYGETPGSLLTGDIPLDMDAARRLLSRPWRMPTDDDFVELFENVVFIDADGNEVDIGQVNKLVNVNGTLGIYLKSKINGARLFFACTGRGYGSSWYTRGTEGYYWTTSFYSDKLAEAFVFASSGIYTKSNNDRFYGFSIRPVWNPHDLRG